MTFALRLVLALVLGLPTAAQLELPKRPAPRKESDAKGAEAESGKRLPGRRGTARGQERPALDLGSGVRRASAEPATPAEEEPLLPGGYTADAVGAARFVFDQLERVRDPDASVALQAIESLSALGGAGLAAARSWLGDPVADNAVQLVVAARLLLREGEPDDRRRVAVRLRQAVPPRAAEPLLRALLVNDPVLGSPRFLIEQLDHPTGVMRAAAQRLLLPRLEPSHVALLAALLRSERADTRERVVQLVAGIDDPAAVNVLYDRLGDEVARVAHAAVELLTDHPDGSVVDELRRLAFATGSEDRVGRRAAHALLALVEREDTWNSPLLDDDVVPELLLWLRAPDELVNGTAAIALAGIGFRSPRSREMSWLDRDVPHALVRLVSGAVFHRDLSSLREPAQRRLRLLSGYDLATDGAAWQRWWLSAAEGFHARRAVLEVRPEEVTTLALLLDEPDLDPEPTLLVGPFASEDVGELARPPRVLYLDDRQCDGLFALLRAEGVLAATRLPSSARGDATEVLLDVRIAGQGKRFRVAPERVEPWLERLVSAVRGVEEANRWQLYFDHARWPDRRAFWAEESGFWRDTTDPAVRGQREKELLVQAIDSFLPRARTEALEALGRLSETQTVLGPGDFADLTLWLEEELVIGPRPRRLVGLALAAGRGTGPDGGLAPSLARELVNVLATDFGDSGREEISRVLAAAGDAGSELALADERPLVRACAVDLLAARRDEASVEQLLLLLDDPAPAVEEAAVRALGERREERARNELHLRARLARGAVRRAALRAVGRLGGAQAREVLMLGLADSDPSVQVASVEALADLADPETLGLFASIFARGSDSPLFAAAQRALRAFGPEAWTEVARLMVTAAPRTRRDAALFLSEQGVPEAASTLMALLTDNPQDGRVAAELAILTGVDLREETDPATAWWTWWDLVVHEDSLAWFLGAAGREGFAPPAAASLRGGGELPGALFLLELLQQPKLHLAERARRELSRLLGRQVDAPPAGGALRRTWAQDLAREIRARWQG